MNKIISLCQDLAVVINRETSELLPTQQVKYLGMLIDFVKARARIDKLREVARDFLAT